MKFRIDLDIFRGPLDLLLYLVRKHEVEITEIPVAAITEQFLDYLSVLEQLDVNAVGDFLEMASQLIEIKSRMVLPRGGEVEEELDDPRQELVSRLLEYKKYKEAASMLEERSRNWQERFPRLADDVPARNLDPAEAPIQEVELWDLVSAFARIMRETAANAPSNIIYDDTPIHVYMEQIHRRLAQQGRLAFSELFQAGMHKSRLIGIFLAVLELVRHHGVTTEQDALFGEIYILPGQPTEESSFAANDEYKHGAPGSSS
jgi:segregation and condensation protein A